MKFRMYAQIGGMIFVEAGHLGECACIKTIRPLKTWQRTKKIRDMQQLQAGAVVQFNGRGKALQKGLEVEKNICCGTIALRR